MIHHGPRTLRGLIAVTYATSWILVLTASMSWAAEPPRARDAILARADHLARWGAYLDADALYQRLAAADGGNPALLAQVLTRRLGVADAMIDLPGVRDLAARIEALPSSVLTPEIRLRVSLARAGAAVRMLDLESGYKHYQDASRLAQHLETPAGAMARFICRTVTHAAHFSTHPPTPQEFSTAWQGVQGDLERLMTLRPAHPTEMLCAANAVRYWTLAPSTYSLEAAMERKQPLVAGWFAVEQEINASARRLLAQGEGQPHPEAETIALHADLDLAEGFCYQKQAALDALARVENGLLERRKRLAQLSPPPRWIEETRIRARMHRARALVAVIEMAARSGTAAGERALAEYEASVRLLQECHQDMEAIDTLNDLAGVALTHHTGDWERLARESLRLSLAESRRLDYVKGQIWALIYGGQLAAATGQLPKAEESLRQAVDLLEAAVTRFSENRETRARIVRQAALAYDLLISVLARQERTTEALEMAARCQEQTQVGLLDPRRITTRDPAVRRALERISRARTRAGILQESLRAEQSRPPALRDPSRVTAISTAIAHNRQEFYQALNDIRSHDPDYERVVAIRPAAFAKIQPMLPADAVVVQYYAAADTLYIFVASRQALKIQTVKVTRDALEQEVRTVREAMKDPGARVDLRPFERDALVRLHRLLIEPVEDDLRSARVLAIVPSGQLYYLPFAALARPRGDGLEYLVERKAVVVMTQLELLEVMREEAPRERGSLLALGNPDGSLPGAQAEVGELSALFGRRQVFLRSDATKERLTHVTAGTDIIHLATHGMLDPEDVNASYLVMAGQGSAARLTAGEIYGLDLKGVSLVTLSACRTAVGERRPGAEIATLAQAFSVAGSRSILASLWNVSDDATRSLMISFYRQLHGGSSRAEALRAAQRTLIASEWSHPFYWSAFELVGDWR